MSDSTPSTGTKMAESFVNTEDGQIITLMPDANAHPHKFSLVRTDHTGETVKAIRAAVASLIDRAIDDERARQPAITLKSGAAPLPENAEHLQSVTRNA